MIQSFFVLKKDRLSIQTLDLILLDLLWFDPFRTVLGDKNDN